MKDPAEELIRRTAALARLEVTPEEIGRLAPQFARILEAFEGLPEPAEDPMERAGRGESRTRPDEPAGVLGSERVLRAAPEPCDGFFAVPKTIEDAE